MGRDRAIRPSQTLHEIEMIHGAPASIEVYGTLVPALGGFGVMDPEGRDHGLREMLRPYRWRTVEMRLYGESFEPLLTLVERSSMPFARIDGEPLMDLLYREVHLVLELSRLDEGVTLVGPFDDQGGNQLVADGSLARKCVAHLLGREVRLYTQGADGDKWVERSFLRGDLGGMAPCSNPNALSLMGSSLDWHLRGATLATMLVHDDRLPYSLL